MSAAGSSSSPPLLSRYPRTATLHSHMKPAPFAYHAPRTVDEAVSLLQGYGDEAKVLAGGQSLMPVLNFRLSAPSVLIDINRVSELAYIRPQPGQLHIGALIRQRQIEFSELVYSTRRSCPGRHG